jgi:hypothetical protein
MVVCGVVCAGCVCAARPYCFVRLTRISASNIWQTMAYWGFPKGLNETNQTITFNYGESVGFTTSLVTTGSGVPGSLLEVSWKVSRFLLAT